MAAPDAFPPFNQALTFKGGDSGSPITLPTTDDVLVFLGGDSTSPASAQMQTDMNTLAGSLGLGNYYMFQYPVQ